MFEQQHQTVISSRDITGGNVRDNEKGSVPPTGCKSKHRRS